jgi:hypothetical protein
VDSLRSWGDEGILSTIVAGTRAGTGSTITSALLDQCRNGGVYRSLEEMAARRRAVLPFRTPPSDQPLLTFVIPELEEALGLAELCCDRMGRATLAQDLPEFISAFETNAALSRMLRHVPVVMAQLVAVTIQQLSFEQVRVALARRPPRAWLDAIQGAVDRQRDVVPIDLCLRGEEISELDALAWFFSDTARIRAGVSASAINSLLGGSGPASGRNQTPLGTYQRNRDAVRAFFENEIRLANIEAWEQRPGGTNRNNPNLRWFDARDLRIIVPTWRAADRERFYRRGLDLKLAIERFRCDHEAYPVNLSDLVPAYLESLPTDPWSGSSFGYHRLEAHDGQDASYVLFGDAATSGVVPVELQIGSAFINTTPTPD